MVLVKPASVIECHRKGFRGSGGGDHADWEGPR
jgi:hypothetical protein